MNIDFQEAEFYFPDLDKTIKGTLHISNEDNYFVLPINPHGSNSWKPIKVAHAKTRFENYSCVECLLFKSDGTMFFYTISELYSGGNITTSDSEVMMLAAEVSFLSYWLKSGRFELKILNESEYEQRIDIKKAKTHTFILGESITLIFECSTNTKFDRRQISVEEKSAVIIKSDKAFSRSKFFEFFYSFLIFYTVFLRKIPETTRLRFVNDDWDVKLLGLPQPQVEKPFDILLEFAQIENFQSILSEYFKEYKSYNAILQLWQAGFRNLDPEIKLLHLTQSLELLHKTFYQDDTTLRIQRSEEISKLYGYNRSPDKWTQIMTYFDFYKQIESANITLPFNFSWIEFILKLKEARNYYTHYHDSITVWKRSELYEVNIILKIWIRSLVLNRLSLSKEKISYMAKRDFFPNMDNDIFSNNFSMRFNNHFTKS